MPPRRMCDPRQVQRAGVKAVATAHVQIPGGSTRAGPGSGAVRLFVAVLSAAANRVQRDAVRATWGSDPRWVIAVVHKFLTYRIEKLIM